MNEARTKSLTVSFKHNPLQVRVLEFDAVDSTNDLCKEMAPSGTKDPFVVRAHFQRKGRGRYDRVWLSPPHKNLLFSIVVYPDLAVSKTPIITTLAAQAIVEVLTQQLKTVLSIKKPNDILCNGKKVAGILTEQVSIGQKSAFIVVGIGLNVNATKEELPAEGTSLAYEEGRSFDLDALFSEIIITFFKKYEMEF
jgi:BirA family transcriptional regulator, biotin operon repressor / biotin---[acetyl-CoA-carboxylase] ligase